VYACHPSYARFISRKNEVKGQPTTTCEILSEKYLKLKKREKEGRKEGRKRGREEGRKEQGKKEKEKRKGRREERKGRRKRERKGGTG
jgi:hypothetical protein